MKNLTKASSLSFSHLLTKKKNIIANDLETLGHEKNDRPLHYRHVNSSKFLINLSSSENVQ